MQDTYNQKNKKMGNELSLVRQEGQVDKELIIYC